MKGLVISKNANLFEVEFEEKKYYIPTDYDALLTALYGDYMTPPEDKDRVPLHSV